MYKSRTITIPELDHTRIDTYCLSNPKGFPEEQWQSLANAAGKYNRILTITRVG